MDDQQIFIIAVVSTSREVEGAKDHRLLIDDDDLVVEQPGITVQAHVHMGQAGVAHRVIVATFGVGAGLFKDTRE